MAYTKSFLRNHASPIERLRRPSDIKDQPLMEDCPDKLLDHINKSLDLTNDLGIIPDEEGRIPKSAGVPRIFIMGQDENQRDRRMSLEEAGIEYGSREFWQQAQLGNVFALPGGERLPVQLTVSRTKNTANVSIRPVGAEEMPELAVKKPTRWQRFVHFFNRKKYAEEISAWNNREANRKSNREMMASIFESRRKVVKDEMDELRDLAAEEAAEKAAEKEARKEAARGQTEQRKKEQLLSEVHRQAGSKETGRQTYRDLVAPAPVFHPELERTGTQQGFYSRESFDKLEKLEHSYSEYEVGGEPVTEDEYCGLVAACSMSPEHAEEGFKKLPRYDPQLKTVLMNGGHSEAEAKEIIAHSYMTMPTIDLMKSKLHNNQDNLLETNVNAGRRDAANALENYKKGNKDDLAKAIAYGVKHTAALSGERLVVVDDDYHNLFHFSAAAAKLLERDADLMKLAKEKYGMKQEDLKALKGLAAIDEADTARRTAKEKLAEAAEGKRVLTPEEKRQCAKDILKANVMEATLTESNALRRSQGKGPRDEEEERLSELIEKNKLMRGDKETRPLPPQGAVYFDQLGTVLDGRQPEFNTHPGSLLKMSDEAWQKNYEKIADRIVKEDKLDELDGPALHEKINGKEYIRESIVSMGSRALQDKPLRVDPLTVTMQVESEARKVQMEGLQL